MLNFSKFLFLKKTYNFTNFEPFLIFFSLKFTTRFYIFNSFFLQKHTFLRKNTKQLFLSFFTFFITNYALFTSFFFFKWFRFVLFSGLGYRKKLYNRYRLLFVYIGNRHWILYKFLQPSFIFPIKRRNFLFFSPSKNWFNSDYDFFSNLRKPYVYKMKGFIDSRIKRRFIFVRRIRLKGIKTKLSKKQQML